MQVVLFSKLKVYKRVWKIVLIVHLKGFQLLFSKLLRLISELFHLFERVVKKIYAV